MPGIFGAPLGAANRNPRMAAVEAAIATESDIPEMQQQAAHLPQMARSMAPQMRSMQADMTQQHPSAMTPQMQTPQQYLRPKRTLSENLGLLADAFSGSDRNTQMLLAREGQHRAEWQAQQNALLKRAQDFADWQTRFDYEQAHKTVTPYRWRSNAGDLMEMGPDGQARVVYDDPTEKTEWIRTTDPNTGELIMTPMPLGGGRPAPQRPSIGATMPDPRKAGGPASAPGSFRR